MSRLKKEILNKLKEYASKMGTNTMGGDDYTSKKRGGLRDFDGYDNVDYNQDMPMDEMQVVNKKTGKDITKHVLALLSGKIDKKKFEKLTGLKKESANEAKVPYNFSKDELKRVLKLLGRNASTEVKMIKAFEKAFGRKLTRDEMFESVNEAKDMTLSDYIKILDKKIEDAQKAVSGKNGSKEEYDNRGDILQNFRLFRNYLSAMDKRHKGNKKKLRFVTENFDNLVESCWKGYKAVGGKIKNGKQVPNCVPEENNIDEADDKLLDVLKKKLSDEGGAAGFKDLEDAADKVGVDLTQDMLKKMSGIKQHRDGDYILEKILDEMRQTHVVVEPNGNVLGTASNEKGAKDMVVSNLRNVKGAKVIKLKKPVSDKQSQKMVGYPLKESKLVNFNQFESLNAWGELPEEDKSGKKLNNPTRGDVKKYKVYVKNDKGNVVKVEFGDPNMSIKRDDPERRKSFRARHNCDNPGPKYKARYWSCKFWSTKSVTDLMKG